MGSEHSFLSDPSLLLGVIMASPDSKTDICNLALRRIGADPVTTEELEASPVVAVAAIHCDLQYEQTRDAIQRSHAWTFNKTRIRLASTWATSKAYTIDQYVLNDSVWYKCLVAHTSGTLADEPGTGAVEGTYWVTLTDAQVTPPFEYTYYFDLPADYLNRRYVFEGNVAGKTNYTYQVEGNKLYTDDATVDLVYSAQVTTVASFDPLYIELLYLTLAKKFATAIAKDAKLEQGIREELKPLMSKVRALDKNEQNTKGYYDYYTHNAARRGYGYRIPSQMGS